MEEMSMKRARILLVDSGSDTTEAISLLKDAGYDVEVAGNKSAGLKKLYQGYTDLIIMNKSALRSDRDDPYLRIRRASYVPIIVLGEQNEAAEVLELGADSFMVSPPRCPRA